MNLNDLATKFRNDRMYLQAEGKEPKFVRMTCEQIAKLKDEPASLAWLTQHESGIKFDGLTVVKRGSLLDCQLREAKPRIPHIDLTKVE